MLIVIAILMLLLVGYKVEVPPATALVYNNIWTGKPDCVLPGTETLTPGLDRILEKEVSLRNEAQDPKKVEFTTKDGIPIEVDFLIKRQQVGFPGMPNRLEDFDKTQKKLLKEAAIKAVTKITYKDRESVILSRHIAVLKETLGQHTYNELFQDANLAEGDSGKLNKIFMKKIEKEVNEELLKDEATTEWGFWNELDLENINLPEILRKSREQSASANMAGKAIADKANAAGVDPTVMVIADALFGFLGSNRGGGK